MHHYNYLALGDSYTIGESIPLHKNFPYQTMQLLRQKGYEFQAPEIVAKTGWTTDELNEAMKTYSFLSKYDFVSLLIGVNNQYRGRDVLLYKQEFEELLKKAIALANGKKERVVVVSIPDYSCTLFAKAMNTEKISKEIEVFNTVNRAVSVQYKVQYLDITLESREAREKPELVAEDKLHPSAIEYGRWAVKMSELIAAQLK